MTLRALDVLKEADVVAAEDTRITARLLAHYGVKPKKMIALHQHNESRAAPAIIADLRRGHRVALASDAGTPAFSDPGARLVAAVRAAGFPVVPIPGPNAAAAALSASGFADGPFVFYGFLPSRRGERCSALEALATTPYTLVFYEAPHRVVEAVADLAAVLGGARRIAIARELTKVFETIHVCDLDSAARWLAEDENRTKGEFVLIVAGAPEESETAAAQGRRALGILLEELPVKQAAALAARLTGARKKALYDLALELKRVQSKPTAGS